MVCSCIAYNCLNRKDKNNPDIRFHKFPSSKPDLEKLWISAVRRQNWLPSKHSLLCSAHFLPEDYEPLLPGSRYRKLKPTAVPSVFDFPTYLLNPVKKRRILERCQNTTDEEYIPYKPPAERFVSRNMDYINCSVPGCKSKCPKDKESSIAVGEQIIHMFPVPSNERLFNKWRKALEGTISKLTRKDHLCELHFQEDEIERFYTKTSDGSVIEIEKKEPTLKYGTIPSLFLDPPVSITDDLPKKLLTVQNSAVNGFKSRNVDTSKISSSNSNDSEENDSTISTVDLIEEKPSGKMCVTYEEVIRNLQCIKKPSKLWSVVFNDKFIIFARWNNKYITEKRIVIESNLNVRVFLKELEVNITDFIDITSINDISALLEKVENYNTNR